MRQTHQRPTVFGFVKRFALNVLTSRSVNVLSFVAAAGDVINGIRVLDAEGSRHGRKYGISTQLCQASRSDHNDPPILNLMLLYDAQSVLDRFEQYGIDMML